MATRNRCSENRRVQVTITCEQIKAIFSAVNTAGWLSAGRICRRDCDREFALVAAIDALEQASGLSQADAEEWLLD